MCAGGPDGGVDTYTLRQRLPGHGAGLVSDVSLLGCKRVLNPVALVAAHGVVAVMAKTSLGGPCVTGACTESSLF